MRPALLLLLVLTSVLLTPASAAAAGCPATYSTVDLSPAGGARYYLGDDGSVWMETNNLAGLQCYPVLIGGRLFQADTRILP